MPRYISLLRGINMVGKRVIKMEALRQMYADLGYTNIKSYIQSGNVLFDTNATKRETLGVTIQKKIGDTFGFYDVPVLILEQNDIAEVLDKHPFDEDQLNDIKRLNITFLEMAPSDELKAVVEKIDYNPDKFWITDKAVYTYCPNGYGRSKLTNNFFEKKLNVKATTRNWRTTNKILSMF